MKNSFSFVAALITLALAGGAATAAGCGGVSTASLCADICACQRCTSNDLAACEAQGDKSSAEADAAGCTSQFDDLVTCAGAQVSCKNDRATFDGCDAQQTALSKCSSKINLLGKTLCELASDVILAKYTSCGGPAVTTTTTGGTTAECTQAAGVLVTCQAACYNAASCNLVVPDSANPPTAEQAQQYVDCATKCQ
jgi:hypothetical protein